MSRDPIVPRAPPVAVWRFRPYGLDDAEVKVGIGREIDANSYPRGIAFGNNISAFHFITYLDKDAVRFKMFRSPRETNVIARVDDTRGVVQRDRLGFNPNVLVRDDDMTLSLRNVLLFRLPVRFDYSFILLRHGEKESCDEELDHVCKPSPSGRGWGRRPG